MADEVKWLAVRSTTVDDDSCGWAPRVNEREEMQRASGGDGPTLGQSDIERGQTEVGLLS